MTDKSKIQFQGTADAFLKLWRWIKAGRGVLVWENAALDSETCGAQLFTPIRDESGEEFGAPYADNSPLAAEHGQAWRFTKLAKLETYDELKAAFNQEEPTDE